MSDDPRFTAYALGEAQEAAVVAEIEAALASDAALRAELEELRGLTWDLRAAVRQPEVVVARPFTRVLPFREEAENAPWRRHLLRMAAVFAVSATAIGLTGWWTSQRETRAQVPERELAVVEVEFAPAEAPAGLSPGEHARTERRSVEARWARLAKALQEGRLPAAENVPGRQEMLGLLPKVEAGVGDRVAVTAAAVPGNARASWLAVTIPAGLAVGKTVSLETRRMDAVTVREIASGFGPGGERVLLFEVVSASRQPVVQVHLAGTEPVAIAAASLWQDFRIAPAALRQAVSLAVFSEALRGSGAESKVALREALKVVEAAGEAGQAVLVLGRRAAELLEAKTEA